MVKGTHDNITRHCVTKMSHLHLTTHEKAKKIVIQLGENPQYVHNVGALAVDSFHKNKAHRKRTMCSFEWSLTLIKNGCW